MNWDDDIDLLAQKKSAAKQGRRAGMTKSPDAQELSLESDLGVGDVPAPIRTRKTGRWADEGTKSARKSSSTNLIEQERFQDSRREDSDDDIPIIPDIDDIQDDMASLYESSKKPMVSVNKATYKELDTELGVLQKKIANVGNINLAFLTTHLYHEEDIKDFDEVWTLDELFETMLSCNK